jgi:hypothetical protein
MCEDIWMRAKGDHGHRKKYKNSAIVYGRCPQKVRKYEIFRSHLLDS